MSVGEFCGSLDSLFIHTFQNIKYILIGDEYMHMYVCSNYTITY